MSNIRILLPHEYQPQQQHLHSPFILLVFAIQNGGACFSGPNADSTYKRYGPSDACKGGRGGAFANSVYKLFDDGMHLFFVIFHHPELT